MQIDHETGRKFNCKECPANLRVVRNCDGSQAQGQAKMFLNNHLYTRCPKAVWLENQQWRFIVNVYFDCKDAKRWPYEGGMAQQTAYCVELFNYLDGLVSEYISREHEKMKKEREKERKELERKMKSGKHMP